MEEVKSGFPYDYENYTPLQLETELTQRAFNANRYSNEWCAIESEYNSKHASKDDVLATIANLFDDKHATARTANARQTKQWEKFMIEHDELRKNALESKIKKENEVRLWDTIRSIMSSRNAERRTST